MSISKGEVYQETFVIGICFSTDDSGCEVSFYGKRFFAPLNPG
jgi:hypothetical protein